MDFKFGSFTRYPDLILMDGGRGQVNIALQVLSELKLAIPVCGMVKDETHKTRGLYFNNVEIPIDTHSEGWLYKNFAHNDFDFLNYSTKQEL